MACGSYEGKGVADPEIRGMFQREALLASDWYRERLRTKQARDIALWKRHIAALDEFRAGSATALAIDVDARLAAARRQLARVSSPGYLEELAGTIGADPFHGQIT